MIAMALTILILALQINRMNLLGSSKAFDNQAAVRFDSDTATTLSEEDLALLDGSTALILYHPQKLDELQNLEMTLAYLDIDFQKAEDDFVKPDFGKFDVVVLLEPDQKNVKNIQHLIAYVESGGKLLYFISPDRKEDPFFHDIQPYLGITEVGIGRSTNTVVFHSEVLLNTLGALQIENEAYDYFYPLELSLSDTVKIHMSSDTGVPMLWETPLGEGKVLCVNYGKYDLKEHRGLVTGALSFLMETLIYPIIDSEVVFIDDFPADYRMESPALREAYGRNMERFVLEIWWPDMVKLMHKYGLVYTGAYVEAYNDDVEGDFPDNENMTASMDQIVRDFNKYGGEISLHGYNHQALLLDQEKASRYGYTSWPDGESIVKSLRSSIRFFNQSYPNYQFTTFVPTSNLLEEDVIPYLLQALPTLETISGVYFSYDYLNNMKSEDHFKQEFAEDSRYGTALPRVTHGAFYSDQVRYNLASAVTTHGIVSHFIHPDDVLDPVRSQNLLWEDIYKQTERLFGAIDQQFGWLVKNKARDASQKIRQYVHADLYYRISGKTMTIAADHFGTELSFILFTYRTIRASKGCDYQKIDNHRYLIRMHQNIVTLEVDSP
jgi:hypothetical protein